MLYVTSSQAYRSGSFSVPPRYASDPAARRTLHGLPCVRNRRSCRRRPAERRVGFRSEWMDGRFRFNRTYYEMDYTDRQAASRWRTHGATGFMIVS